MGKATTSLWRLGPVALFSPKKNNKLIRDGGGFTWEASVDRATGKAYAKEVSYLPHDWSQRLQPQQQRGKQQQQSSIILKTEKVLGQYPNWLCRGSVTLGILQAVPVGSGAGAATGGTRIQTRLGGIPILTFGKPVGQRVAITSQNIRDESIQWTYPIVGGIMAAKTTPSAPSAGKLVVTLRSVATEPVLDTQLVDYRPALVGGGGDGGQKPANPIRVALYLGSQSAIHGYAMWRYHRYVRNYSFADIATKKK